jgi:hypothetical protein
MSQNAPTRLEILSCAAMAHVRIDAYENDFEFLVNGMRYSCPSFLAEFISPAIARCRQNDPTVSTFVISVSCRRDLFPTVLQLCRGSAVEVGWEDLHGIVSIFTALDNPAFVRSMISALYGDAVSDANAIERLRLKCWASIRPDLEVSYLANRFHCLSESMLGELSDADLTQILCDPSLRLKSEDSLYAFLESRTVTALEFSNLLQFVRFEFLSNEAFSRFIAWSLTHANFVNGRLWVAICRRLPLCPLLRPHSSSARHSTPVIDHSSDPPVDQTLKFSNTEMAIERFPFLHGIVASLKQEHGSLWQNHVKVTSSSICDPRSSYDDVLATSVSPCSGFASKGVADSWLEYEFLHATVFPTHYAIRSWFPGCCTSQRQRQWTVRGWTPSNEEVDLDACTTATDLIHDHLVVTFPIHSLFVGFD